MKADRKIKWGIVATGRIAHLLADALSVIPEAELYAVCSRSNKSAKQFAKSYSIPHFTNDIDKFLALPELDVVYIATPHNFHVEPTLKALNAGKHVLCEKPMGINQVESQKMIDLAQNNKVFLMEAVWMCFFPAIQKALELVASGEIGTIKQIKSDFSFKAEFNPEHRLFNPNLAGGALLDLGVYNIYFSQLICPSMPIEIAGLAHIGSTQVDETSAFVLKYADDIIAQGNCSVVTESTKDAYILGSDGYLHIPQFWNPDKVHVVKGDKTETFAFDRFGNGYTYEILEVHECIRKGKTQSDIVSHQHSLRVIQIMDKLREKWKLRYPAE